MRSPSPRVAGSARFGYGAVAAGGAVATMTLLGLGVDLATNNTQGLFAYFAAIMACVVTVVFAPFFVLLVFAPPRVPLPTGALVAAATLVGCVVAARFVDPIEYPKQLPFLIAMAGSLYTVSLVWILGVRRGMLRNQAARLDR